MKNEIIADILMVVAIVLGIAGIAAVWGMYTLGATIPVMCLVGGALFIGSGACFSKMHEIAVREDETKEERL